MPAMSRRFHLAASGRRAALRLLVCCCLLALAAPMSLRSAETASPSASPRVPRFVCTDYTAGKVCIIDAAGAIEWEYPAPNCNDLWVLPNGNLLFNTGRGVKEVARDGKIVFAYESAGEVFACQRLPDGNTFIGECTLGRLIEVSPAGEIVWQLRLLPEGKSGGHSYMRNARRLANGHALVAHYGAGVVREYDRDGALIREIQAPGGPHSVARLPNGNTLIACGDKPNGSRVFEIDPAGATVWELRGDELPGVAQKFMAGFQRLANGHTVVTNWLGHGKFGQAPHIFEVTADKKIVWSFADHEHLRTVSSIQLLDEPGDSTKYEIVH
jgi:hypothetical protein